uniref:Uncharacterized protein n=1 Tax=Lactuca sativa TaxID=4236 RepID=A0A9R1V3J9_LACSA|nr:hypothetical protein LSAT_V11C700378770 [Lactuca sativa]
MNPSPIFYKGNDENVVFFIYWKHGSIPLKGHSETVVTLLDVGLHGRQEILEEDSLDAQIIVLVVNVEILHLLGFFLSFFNLGLSRIRVRIANSLIWWIFHSLTSDTRTCSYNCTIVKFRSSGTSKLIPIILFYVKLVRKSKNYALNNS